MPILTNGTIRSDAHMSIDEELRQAARQGFPVDEVDERDNTVYLTELLGEKIAEAFVRAANVATEAGKDCLNSEVRITFSVSYWDIAVRLVMEVDGGGQGNDTRWLWGNRVGD